MKTEKYTAEKSNTLFKKYCDDHDNFLSFFRTTGIKIF